LKYVTRVEGQNNYSLRGAGMVKLA